MIQTLSQTIVIVIEQDSKYITFLKPKILKITLGVQEQIELYITSNSTFMCLSFNITYNNVNIGIL